MLLSNLYMSKRLVYFHSGDSTIRLISCDHIFFTTDTPSVLSVAQLIFIEFSELYV